MTALDRGEVIPALPWPAEGVGDFADLAWVLAQAFGNGPGVRGIDVHRGDNGTLRAQVSTTGPEYVRDAAASFGWHLHESDDGYADAFGSIGDVRVSVMWLDPHRFDRGRAAAEAVSS